MKLGKFSIPIYGQNIVLAEGGVSAEGDVAIGAALKLPMRIDKGPSAGRSYSYEGRPVAVWLKSRRNKGCVVHESVHLAKWTLKYVGVEVEDDEVLAYLVQYIYDAIVKAKLK